MASPAQVITEAAAAAATATDMKEKEKREGPGILARIWRALFGGRGEDYEKRLQYLSKEEAAVLARMRRRAQFSRRGIRNLIVLSVLGEVGAIIYAVIMTKLEDLDWQMRAIRVLPMFLLPAISSMIYSILPSKVVGHYQGSGTNNSGWIAKIAALLVGEDPSQSYALICGNCRMHNGLARKEYFPHVTYYCPHCHAFNMSNQSIGQFSSSDSGHLSPVIPGDGIFTAHRIAETELSSTTEVQELPEEKNAGKQPMEPAE